MPSAQLTSDTVYQFGVSVAPLLPSAHGNPNYNANDVWTNLTDVSRAASYAVTITTNHGQGDITINGQHYSLLVALDSFSPSARLPDTVNPGEDVTLLVRALIVSPIAHPSGNVTYRITDLSQFASTSWAYGWSMTTGQPLLNLADPASRSTPANSPHSWCLRACSRAAINTPSTYTCKLPSPNPMPCTLLTILLATPMPQFWSTCRRKDRLASP